MSIPSRRSSPDQVVAGDRTFLITSACIGHQAILQSDRNARLLCDVLQHYRREGKYRLHAFVIMPDHFHALLTVDGTITVERAVQLIKGGFSFRAAKELELKSEIWQRGFSEVRVKTREEFLSYKEYIHDNPVRRRLCLSSHEFLFSSAFTQGLKPPDLGAPDGTTKVVP